MTKQKKFSDFSGPEELAKTLSELPVLREQGVIVHKVERTDTGYSFYINEPKQSLAFSEHASIVTRDPMSRGTLDLIGGSPMNMEPQKLFERSIEYYYTKGLYGTVIEVLANFSMKGFENEIDDDDIKYFFDSWNIQVDFDQVLEWIYFDLFRTGFVRTYKVHGKFLPPISYLKPPQGAGPNVTQGYRGYAAKKIKWSASDIPIKYTVLNPTLVFIEGNLLFDQTKITLKPSKELMDLIKKADKDKTKEEKEIIKRLPPDFIKSVKDGKNAVIDPTLVGSIDYRKMPYEKYPKPRGTRAFDSLDFKEKLMEADFSTLDGITNAILKITVGSDEFPVTDQAELERVAELFNTTSKSFNVVWNHTLKIEKIMAPEIGNILGADKYKPVNDDLTGAFGIVRALIDGVGTISKGAADLAVKSIIEEVNYARRQVTRWIYKEYREVAAAVGFDRHPKVRWDDKVLKDELMMMSLIQGMIDRRIISYETGHELLGFDHSAELQRLTDEKPLVLNGDLGLWGSPYNPKAQPWAGTPTNTQQPTNTDQTPVDTNTPNPNDTQLTPDGTPSEGRPRGGPGKKKAPVDTTKVKIPKTKKPSQVSSSEVAELLMSMSEEDMEDILEYILAKKEG